MIFQIFALWSGAGTESDSLLELTEFKSVRQFNDLDGRCRVLNAPRNRSV
jgi:hypothetical protein